MCWVPKKGDVAGSLSSLTGMSFENALMAQDQVGIPTVVDRFGHVNAKAFGDLARTLSPEVSSVGIVREVARLKNTSFENAMMDLNRVEITPFRPTGGSGVLGPMGPR